MCALRTGRSGGNGEEKTTAKLGLLGLWQTDQEKQSSNTYLSKQSPAEVKRMLQEHSKLYSVK